MILIVDDNKYRRESALKEMRRAFLPCIARPYQNYEYVTKPIITILVSPKKDTVSSLMNDNTTVYVVVAKRKDDYDIEIKHLIVNENGNVSANDVKDIIKEEYGFSFVQDTVNFIHVDNEGKQIFFGGKNMYFTNREYNIARFFIYQRDKIFSVDDILEYLHKDGKLSPQSFEVYVSMINSKCNGENREKMIIKNTFGYGITCVTGKLPELK